jgi:hypothetical protein
MSTEHSESERPKNAFAARWSFARERCLTNAVLAIAGTGSVVVLSAVTLLIFQAVSQMRLERDRIWDPHEAVRVAEARERREALHQLEHKPAKNLDRMF